MSNLRIIYDNAADRATVSSSATQTGLGVSNTLSDIKSKVCRSTTTSLSIYAAWTTLETIGGIANAFTNISPTTTARIRLTNEVPNANMITYSQQMENTGSWSQTGVTLTSGIPAPDGTSSAVHLQETTDSSAHEIRTSLIAFTAGNYYTMSAFLKAGTRQFGYVGLPTAAFGSPQYVIFDLTSGTPALTVGTPASSSIQAVTGMPGWYRCAVTALATTTASGTCYLGMKSSAIAGAYVGDGSSRIYAWGGQVELGYMTSYYPTTSAAATRPFGYIDKWQSYAYDSGNILFSPAPYKILHGLTQTQASSAYAYGGGKYACFWLPNKVSAYGLAVDITDTNNLQGYVEVSRLICGDYWAPSVVDVQGTSLQVVDTSSHSRTDGGDLYTYVGTKHRKQALNLPSIEPTSRKQLWDIMWGNGISKPIFISTYSNNTDASLEAAHMLYGKLSQTPSMGTPYFNYVSATIEIEEV